MFKFFVLICLVLFSSAGWGACECNVPDCKKNTYLQPYPGRQYMTNLLGMDIDDPKSDLARRIEYKDYRFLVFPDRDSYIRIGDKMTDDLYLRCVMGVKVLYGFESHEDVVDLSDPEYGNYLKAFRAYAKRYNKLLYDKLKLGFVHSLNDKYKKSRIISENMLQPIVISLNERDSLFKRNILFRNISWEIQDE